MLLVVDMHIAPLSSVLAGDAKAIAAGMSHSLVLKTDGNVWATGDNLYGQLGDGSDDNKNELMQVIGTIPQARALPYPYAFCSPSPLFLPLMLIPTLLGGTGYACTVC